MLTVYIICFGVGLVLTIATALFGDVLGSDGHSSGHAGTNTGPSPFSMTTMMAFLTGFGGIGWLLLRTSAVGAALIAILAALGGLLLSTILFLFFAKVLLREDHAMRESDFTLNGTLATISIPIPEHGIGEIKFVLQGTTRSMGAVEEQGRPLARGMKVAVIGSERGLAIVTPLQDDLHSI